MYDPGVVRSLFDRWEGGEIQGDPGEPISRWLVPHVNHMLLERWLPERGLALDACCGRGIESVRMARRGLEVTALDLSPGLLRHARRRAEAAGVAERITFVEADLAERLPLPADHFDVCLALTGVLGHVGRRHPDAAANLVACCRAGGLLIVGVQSYLGKIRQYLGQGRIAEAEHVAATNLTHTVSDAFEDYCFTTDEFLRLFADLGCSVEFLTGAPTICADGYPDLPKDAFRRALALEQRFLGTPELLGMGEQLVGVFRKRG